MKTPTQIVLDNLLNRNRYVSSLGERVEYFRKRWSSVTPRVIDEVDESGRCDHYLVPEVAAADFNNDILVQSMQQRGCLIVRGFFEPAALEGLKAYIDHGFDINSEPRGLLKKYMAKQADIRKVFQNTNVDIKEKQKTNPTYTDTVRIAKNLTQPLSQNKSLLTAQAPILTEKFLQFFESNGLKKILADYFGTEPCVSIYKSLVRRAPPPENPIDFHQDGTFMGDEISALNAWIPVSNCGPGYDVHGLDIVPVRLMRAFGKGTGHLDWTISPQAVIDEYGEEAIVSPTFKLGDLLFFDHLLMHRTQSISGHSAPRYAIETWFFDSINFPKNQIPMRW